MNKTKESTISDLISPYYTNRAALEERLARVHQLALRLLSMEHDVKVPGLALDENITSIRLFLSEEPAYLHDKCEWVDTLSSQLQQITGYSQLKQPVSGPAYARPHLLYAQSVYNYYQILAVICNVAEVEFTTFSNPGMYELLLTMINFCIDMESVLGSAEKYLAELVSEEPPADTLL